MKMRQRRRAACARMMFRPNVIDLTTPPEGLHCRIVVMADAGMTYQWMRGGQPIPGATGPSYTPTAEDIGHSVGPMP